MSYKQVRDVLDNVRRYHRSLADFYDGMSDSTHGEKLHELLQYMGRHEKHIETALGKYERDNAAQGILDTWVQFEFDEGLKEALQETELQPDMSVEDVVRYSMKMDQAFKDLYRQMAEYTNSPRVEELFRSLLELEERKEEKFAWSTQELDPDQPVQ